MRLIPISSILIEDRQRKEIKPGEIQALKTSIVSKGLLHPIVCRLAPDGSAKLLAGERRLRAMTELHNEGHEFTCDLQPVPPDQVPVINVAELTADDFAEAELEENVLRVALTWLEEAQARDLIHRLRQARNPMQTYQDTAREVSAIVDSNPDTERRLLSKSTIVARHADNPKVRAARSLNEAVKIVMGEAEAKFKAAVVQHKSHIATDHRIILGDCTEVLKTLPRNSVDTIIVDPPYGMRADKMGKGEFHMYDDSPEAALSVCKTIIREGFHVAKSRALLFMFCDIDHFVTLREYCKAQAWSVWRTPIIWDKAAPGHAPWGRAGFQRSYELMLFATKGQKELLSPGGSDVVTHSRVGRAARMHAAEKPIALLDWLLSISTIPGQVVLDPCCGSGAIIAAARPHKVRVIGIEKDPIAHTAALARLHGEDPEQEESEDDGKQRVDLLSD